MNLLAELWGDLPWYGRLVAVSAAAFVVGMAVVIAVIA